MTKQQAEQQGLIDNKIVDAYMKYYQDTQPTIELISSLTVEDNGNVKYNELITGYSLKVLSEYGCNMATLGKIHRLDIDPNSTLHQDLVKFEGLKVLDPMLVDDLLIIMATLVNTHLRYFTVNGEPSDDSKVLYLKSLSTFYIDIMMKEDLHKFFDMGTTGKDALDIGSHIIEWMSFSCAYAYRVIKMLYIHLQERYGKDSNAIGYPYLFTLLNREPYLYYVDSRDLQQRKEQRDD